MRFSCSEHSIAQAKVAVMVYDDASKEWLPAGTGASGFSNVHVFAHDVNNTFRVVGGKIHDDEVS